MPLIRVGHIALLLCGWMLTGPAAFAGTISLGWSPVADPRLAGYRVHYGLGSGSYDHAIDVGPATSITLEGLADCTAHYVAVQSIDATGAPSPNLSSEISGWPRPRLAPPTPGLLQPGAPTSLTIDGANFEAGAGVVFPRADGIAVGAVTVEDCHRMRVELTIAPEAIAGPRRLHVVNPDGAYGTSVLFVGHAAGPIPDLAIHLSLDTASIVGNLAFDQSGNGLTGTLVGPIMAPGRFGQALRFRMLRDDHVVVPPDDSLDLGTGFTVAAWIHPDSFGEGSGGAIFDKLSPSGDDGYALRLTNLGGLRFRGLSEQFALSTNPGVVRLDEWQHVAVTHDGATLSFYVNGLPVATHAALHPPRPNVVALYIGNDAARARDFDGRLDDVRIYARALGPVEIQELIDPILVSCFDWDGDGFAEPGSIGCPPGSVLDCDDANPDTFPGAAESCDGRDDDCDGAVDEDGVCDPPADLASPAAHWTMDATSIEGTTLLDTSGNGYHGEIQGAALGAGRFGEALRFAPGENDRVLIPTAPGLDLAESCTIVAWIYAESHGQQSVGTILDKLLLSDALGFRLQLSNDSGSSGLTFAGVMEQSLVSSDPGTIVLRRWQQVAVTYDSGVLSFFVDGEPAGSFAALHDPRASLQHLTLGNDWSQTKAFHGLIDDVRIYRTALTPAQLAGIGTENEP